MYNRKLRFFVILVALLLFESLPAFAFTLSKAPLNPAFVDYQKSLSASKTATSSKFMRKLLLASPTTSGYVPSPVNWDHLNNVSFNISSSAARQASPLPSVYDVRRMLPAAKNQVFGNCWVHAPMAAISSNLVTKKICSSPLNLSEWYLTYYAYQAESADKPGFTTQGDIYNVGGDDWRAAALLARGTGALLESKCANPTTTGGAYNPGIKQRNFKVVNILYLGSLNIKEVPLSGDRIAQVKNAIMKYGAASIGIRQIKGNSAILSGDIAYYNPDATSYTKPDHSVAIVGWDDNYAISNFAQKPKKPGAWIVRNSWGTSFGKAGNFYVSYEEGSLRDGIVYDSVKEPGHERIYQYDPLGCCTFIGNDTTSSVWFANMFTAQGNDTVTSVAFYVSDPNTTYTINIYAGCTSSPISGTLMATKTVTLGTPGYNTVAFDNTVKLASGAKFSVVIKADSSKADVAYFKELVPVEQYIAGYSENATANPGEGWLSDDGVTFTDVTKVDDSNTSICVKVFATEESSSGGESGGGGCNAGFTAILLLAIVPLAFCKKITK
jgi:Synergist-CTERM protein sorting domain-containing protein